MPSSLPTRIRVVALALAAAALPGCVMPTAGSYGVLAFQYHVDDGLFDADVHARLAVGAQVDLDVLVGKGTRARLAARPWEDAFGAADPMVHAALPREPPRSSLERASVRAARSLRPEVVEVISLGPSRVRIRGVAPGTALVRVEADGGSDVIPVQVAVADRAEVDHWALGGTPSAPPPVWVKGGVGRFLVSTRDAEGVRLIGFGEPPPLAIQPAGAAAVEHAPADVLHVDVRFAVAGDVTLEPRRGPPLRVRVVEPQAITSLEIRGGRTAFDTEGSLHEVAAGGDLPVHVLGSLGHEKVLLLGDAVTMEAGPPGVCAMVPAGDLGWARRVLGDGFEAVHGVAPGTCVVEAHLGASTGRAEIVVKLPEKKAAGP